MKQSELFQASEAIASMYAQALAVGYLKASADAMVSLLGGAVACTMTRSHAATPLCGMSETELGQKIYGLPPDILQQHPLLGKRNGVTRLSSVIDKKAWRDHVFCHSLKSVLRHEDEIGIDIILEDSSVYSLCSMRDIGRFTARDEAFLALLLPHLQTLPKLTSATITRHPLEALTRREKELAEWLPAGKTNEELARILGISPATVKRHLENIYRKLGSENRFAATTIVLQSQWQRRS